MFPPVETKNASAVAHFVENAFSALYPGTPSQLVRTVFRDVERLFCGANPDYRAIDLRYHDLQHTLQATVCVAQILIGRHSAGIQPALSPRQFELAISAVLLHDAGYLKLRSDTQGTGAKYTYCHVLRSCAFAASYLPTLGVSDLEVEVVLEAINCTGPKEQVSRLAFRDAIERFIGCAVATGDYLGQMAAPDYPDELEILFNEFKESDDFIHLPAARRAFSSPADLAERTPAFWHDVVWPKLRNDLEGAYRFLADPYPNGSNAYLVAVEENLVTIKDRTLSGARHS